MSPGTRSPREGPGSDPRRWPVRRAESFGGVVVRSANGRHEVALIRTKNMKGKEVWTLPKGTAEEGETREETALREVLEETGIEAAILEPLEDITYWFVVAAERSRFRKTVSYYLMKAIGGDPSRHDDEVEEVRFVPVDEAARWATYASDKKVLKRLTELTQTW